MVNATRKLFLHFQNRETPLSVHREKFDSLVVVIEGFGVSIGEHPKLINEELNLLEDNEREDEIVVKAATLVARDRVLGMIFLTSGGRNKYGTLMMDLENDETKGFDNYPKSVVDAYDLMIRYRTPKRAPFNRNNANESMSFVNKGSIDKSKVECYSCHQMDHYANVCPKK